MHFLNIVFGFGVTGVFCALCGDNQQSSVGGQYCFIALGKERRRTKQVDRIGSAFKQNRKGVEEDWCLSKTRGTSLYHCLHTKPRNIQTLLKIANDLN